MESKQKISSSEYYDKYYILNVSDECFWWLNIHVMYIFAILHCL